MGDNFFSRLPSSTKEKINFNVGTPFDVIYGHIYTGPHGESIINGGMPGIWGIEGGPNSFKTTILLHFNLMILKHFPDYKFIVYDPEYSLSMERIYNLYNHITYAFLPEEQEKNIQIINDHVKIVNIEDLYGDEYFELVKTVAEERKKDKRYTVPFKTKNNKTIKMPMPFGFMVDSLTNFTTKDIEAKLVDKSSVGSSDRNMYYMRKAAAIKQMINQMPRYYSRYDIYFGMSAHMGLDNQLDPHAVKKPSLSHSKRGTKALSVSDAFVYTPHCTYEIQSTRVLWDKNQGVLYPKTEWDKKGIGKDLSEILLVLSRNKFGSSGVAIPLIASQEEGILVHESCFHYIKHYDHFGLIQKGHNYRLALYPDLSFSRTTLRQTVNSDPKFRRALEITMELLLLYQHWTTLASYIIHPQDLYVIIKELGYDWDKLLDTRSYWVFTELEKNYQQKYLSTLDLLKMAKKEYHPWWYPKTK